MNPCLYSDNARRFAKQKALEEARREKLKQNLADGATVLALLIACLVVLEIYKHL